MGITTIRVERVILRLVAFKAAEKDKYGNPVWQVYASEPEAKSEPQKPAS